MVVTILTGKRAVVLDNSIQSILKNCPKIFDEKVIIFNNAGDRETKDVIAKYNFFDRVIENFGVLSIGEAISLLASAVYTDKHKYWLSMEDDFICTGDQLELAKQILNDNPEVGQVRLRRADDGGLPYHMVTKQTLVWQKKGDYKTAHAHRTFNNSLTRVADIPKCFPCTGEKHCQTLWHEAGMHVVAQIIPGMFKHDDKGNSLRNKTGCET